MVMVLIRLSPLEVSPRTSAIRVPCHFPLPATRIPNRAAWITNGVSGFRQGLSLFPAITAGMSAAALGCGHVQSIHNPPLPRGTRSSAHPGPSGVERTATDPGVRCGSEHLDL